jgi:hypothetical protein
MVGVPWRAREGFYRLQQWAPRVTSGLQFGLVSVKRRGERHRRWLPQAEKNHKEPQASQGLLRWSAKVGKPEGGLVAIASVLQPDFGEGR